MDRSLSKLRETVKDREAWRVVVHELQRAGHDWGTEPQKALLPIWRRKAGISAREDLAQIWFPSCWDFKSELP